MKKMFLGSKKNIYGCIIIIGGIAFCVILFNMYLRYGYLIGYDSDKAVALLQARNIINGKFFKGGEYGLTVNGVTTWTLNVLICACLVGFNRKALYVAGAIAYMSVVLLATCNTLLKCKKKAIITFCMLLVPPPLYYVSYVGTVMHIEAYAMIMALFLLIYRYYRKVDFINKGSLIAIFVISFLGNVGDSMFILVFSIPFIITSLVNFLYNKIKKISIQDFRKALFLTEVVVFSLASAQLFNFFLQKRNIYKWGGYEARYTVTLDELPEKFWKIFEITLNHYNANLFGIPIASKQFVTCFVGLIVLFFVCISFIFTIYNWKNEDVINRLIVISILFVYSAVIFSDVSAGIERYLTPTVLLSAVLIGRNNMMCFMFDKMGIALRYMNILLFLFLVIPICNHIKLPQYIIYNEYDELAEYLKEENLVCGYGEFWNSNYITVSTNFQVQMLPIGYDVGNGRLHRNVWGNNEQNYFEKAQFVVLNEEGVLKEEVVFSVLGYPIGEKTIGQFKILIYDYDISSRIYTESRSIDSIYNAYEIMQMSRVENVRLEKELIIMKNGGVICENYMHMQQGTYKGIISGENLLGLGYDVYCNSSQTLYPLTELYKDENRIEYIFTLDEDVDAIENRMYNNIQKNVEIYSLEIQQYSNDFT